MHRSMPVSRSTFVRLFHGAVVVSGCMLMSACPGKDKAAPTGDTQVAAEVNDSEISVHQVQSVLQMQPQLSAQLGEAAAGRVLDSLIEQELAAQAARHAGVDSSPKVLQAMELAKREVLARAYQDMLADKAGIPDSKSIDAYYEAHPELFAHRKQYTLQELQLRASPEQAAALMKKVEAASGAQAVNAIVQESGLPHQVRVTVQWAEGLPMDILPQLATLADGKSIGLNSPSGFVILTVLQSQEVPVMRGAAEKTIKAALIATKRRELVKQGMDELRQKAKIVRQGAFAASAPSASANEVRASDISGASQPSSAP